MRQTPSPRWSTVPRPYVNIDTTVVLDRALVELADRRFLPKLDTPTQLHVLASLIAQAESWVREQVAIVRDDGASWAEVGRLVGSTATAARQRWAAPAHPTARPATPVPLPSEARP